MVLLLVALLVAAYVISAFQSGAWWDIPATELLELGASYAPAVADGESWRLVTAIFLHGGLLHLLFNGVALIEIGRLVARQLGPAVTLGSFLLAGAAGFFASLLWHPEGISVGASGGVFGLLGIWASLVWRLPSNFDDNAAATPSRRRRSIAVFVVLLAVGSGFLIPDVDHAAHLAGLLTGLLAGIALRPGKRHWLEFFASSALLGGLLLAAPASLPESLRIEQQEIRAYTDLYRQFAEEDRAISERLRNLGEASRRHEVSDAAGLDQLDGEILPRLETQTRRFREQDWQTARLARDAAHWDRYASLRLRAVQALRRAVASDQPSVAQVELERFERLMQEAAQLALAGRPLE